jgi:hypothetical protein
MIVVQAALVPHGNPDSKVDRLCTVHIVNDGTGTRSRRNYDVKLYSRGLSPRLIKSARIEGYPSQSKAAWHLIAEAFRVLEEEG